ncbi:hypothetical protein LshimejAT787_1201220 [Lyophyllum shimeji]|uniref:Uncharacterized protein n=1 Tax=Lyophyllum shimeji TaxID=47721 RepID=A0A9P3PVA1_LYOSH|nr:hypothetical protein LshimejAT787_1201220 [Lyophyllum shimeji]
MPLPYLSADHNSQASLNEGSSVRIPVLRDASSQQILHEIHKECAEEEIAQAVGEQARGKEFDQMMAELNQAFATNQQRREQLFLEADARQQETFERNEPERESVFLEGQASRAAAFEAHEAGRAQRSEWHNAAREALLSRGSQARKAACDAIEAALVEQFDKLLKSQEDSFTAEERRRDGIVQKLLEDDRGSKSGSQARYEVNRSPSPFPGFIQHGEPNQVVASMPMMPPTIIQAPSTRSNSSSRSGSPRPVAVIQLEPKGSSAGDAPFPALLDSTEAQLVLKNYMANRFQALEAARDEAEADRTSVFDQKEQDRTTRFRTMLESHEEHFRGREARRNEARIQRQARFDIAQGRQSQAFDTSLSQIEAKAEADDSLEENLTQHMKKTVESLSNRQIAQLQAEREDQSTRFDEAQRRRCAEVGVPSSISSSFRSPSPSPSPPTTPAVPRSPYMPPGIVMRSPPTPPPIVVQPPMWRSRSRNRSWSRSISPDRRGRSQQHYHHAYVQLPQKHFQQRTRKLRPRTSPSPPGCFAATALFRGVNIQRFLPIPGSDFASTFEYYASTLNLSQEILEEAENQERVQQAFRQDIERRRHIFNINEARRRAEFEKQQRARRMMFAGSEDDREDEFRQAQRRRELAFQAAEQKRATDFHQEESQRDAAFKQAQEERARRFHAKQEELQKKCFEAEQRRSSDLDSWGAQLLRGRKREQMEAYKNEEAAREAAFQRWLGAYMGTDDGVSEEKGRADQQNDGWSQLSERARQRKEGSNLRPKVVEHSSTRSLPTLKSFRHGRSFFSPKS